MTQVIFAGAPRFRADIRDAAQMLDDLTPANVAAAHQVERAAASTVPRLTGRLASSVRSHADRRAGIVESSLVYAGVIHYGWRAHGIRPQPWLVDAAHRTEPSWVSEYETRMDSALDRMAKVYSR